MKKGINKTSGKIIDVLLLISLWTRINFKQRNKTDLDVMINYDYLNS